MKPILPIAITIIGFLTLLIFSDSPADAKDTKEITIIRGGQKTTVTIVTKDEAITTYIDSVMNEITKEDK